MTDTKRAPLDVSGLSLPAKVITIAGDLFAWEETDPPWAGEWAFPASGWTEEHRASWVRMSGTLIGVTREHDDALVAASVIVESPAFLLANLDAEIAEKKRQTDINARLAEGIKAVVAARKLYGANMRHLRTVEGDVVIMVGMNAEESDRANASAKAAAAQRLQHDPSASAEAEAEYLSMQRNTMLAKCVAPVDKTGACDRVRIREIANAHPGLWDDLFAMRNDMARARVDDEGKGFAP